MPLSKLQSSILRTLAQNRDPQSYVAGGTLLTRGGPRSSDDIDIFHDREEKVARAADVDSAALERAGMRVRWQRREPSFFQALVEFHGETTKLEWVVDSDFRFFPIQEDAEFGYALHPVDLACNKVMAAAGRREPRDIVDVVTIHDEILPIGAVIWAAVEKALGFTPEGLIDEIRRNSNYVAADFRRVASSPPTDAAAIMSRLREALRQAEAFVARMPTEKIGLLFLEGGKIVQPDPGRLEAYATHAGRREGHWPSSSEIGGALLERHSRRAP